MATKVLFEDRRRRYPDGQVMGAWGDVFVVLAILTFIGCLVSIPIMALHRHIAKQQPTIQQVENE